MALFNDFKNKKILVLGIGEEGIDTISFLKSSASYKELGVADILPYEKIDIKAKKHLQEGVNLHLGKDYLLSIKNYDVIIKAPGISPSLLKLKEGQKLTSQTDIFLGKRKEKTIGVTGTKGKSTTSLLISSLLTKAGYTVELVGNIGTPALSFLLDKDKNKFFVYELSSFQLETVTSSPKMAVILNIFVDHLDRHQNFKEYTDAKEKITRFQTSNDFLIYNNDDEKVKEIAGKSNAKKIPFTQKTEKENIPTFLDPLFKVAEAMEIDSKIVEGVIKDFKGLPHRMEYLGRYKDIDFYNDSAATIPEATKNAIDKVKNTQTLILGGVDKGGKYESLVKKIKESKNIRNLIVFKGTPQNFIDSLDSSEKLIFPAANMEEALQHTFNNTKQGGACILSPGFASFNMFKNYKDRGEVFKNCIRKYQ